ncbi:MAG: T9SS type A sorting domain-containing protein [Bacteroidetes bacterium]|nr:T9SS type A sorting domain-containing protein [Bacteroidota bacterium]
MKKLLLWSAMAITGLCANAQEKMYRDTRLEQSLMEERPVVLQKDYNSIDHPRKNRAQRSITSGTKLISDTLGSAGNLLTVLNNECNQIDVNDSLNIVTFIHRNDDRKFLNTNVAQYRFDISKNRGVPGSWTKDIGPITNDVNIDNVSVNGRFPQAGVYNPAGNTIVDSAYLVYSGTWHNGDAGGWTGQMRGRGQLSGDLNSFDVHIDTINNGNVEIASGFCQSAPGIFWNLNLDRTGGFNGNANHIVSGFILEKGIWNSTTKQVDWTEHRINQNFAYTTSNSYNSSVITGWNMDFDPTGQYGWIVCLGDITQDNDNVYNPIFWKTTDGGNNWTGPIAVELDNFTDLVNRLDPSSSGTATTTFENDLVVDYLGNPHLLVVVSKGSSYSISVSGLNIYDITYDANTPSCILGSVNGWRAVHISNVETFRGVISNDNPAPLTQDNRPLASKSKDGKKLFFFWVDSDSEFLGSAENNLPNLMTRGYDLEHFVSTPVINLTEGDELWGGETSRAPGGLFGGATFGTASLNALQNNKTYNVPFVFTQIDYPHDPASGLGSYLQPCAFWYVSNIDFDPYDFSVGLAASIQLNGADTTIVVTGNTYTEDGATISYDTACYKSGDLNLVVDNSNVNTNIPGSYFVYYTAEDSAGNVYAAKTKVVLVGSAPVADFNWAFPSFKYRAVFTDLSTNEPNKWKWNFGDSQGSSIKNPVHNYATNDTFEVCLETTNLFGTSASTCKSVAIIGVGIEDLRFEANINVFPNPSNGNFRINFAEGISSDVTVSVYNILGETVSAPARYKAGITNVDMNLSSVANGIYLVKITNDKGTAVRQITVSHK